MNKFGMLRYEVRFLPKGTSMPGRVTIDVMTPELIKSEFKRKLPNESVLSIMSINYVGRV